MKHRLARPVFDEAELAGVASVLDSGVLTNGPQTEAFERSFAQRHDVEHAVAMANGTVALTAALLALGIEPGDEVIVPSMTFVATAAAVRHIGAVPVFADVDESTLDLDPRDVEQRVTARTRAVVAVHYGGQIADMPGLGDVARRHGLLVVEDAAQAHGATLHGRSAGSWGAAAMFSLSPTKTITTGEGGIVTTNSATVSHQLRLLRNHGISGTYSYTLLGHNWRLTEMQAAIGRAQLEKLDAILEHKRRNARRLSARLEDVAGVRVLATRPRSSSSHSLFTVVLGDGVDRADTIAALNEHGVESKVYWPPVHTLAPFESCGADLPVTRRLAGRILTVPCHAGMDDAAVDAVAGALEAGVCGR